MTAANSHRTALDNSLYLELPAAQLEAAPQNRFSTAGAAERAWLNRMALSALQTWLREDMGLESQAWPSDRALPSLWELLNGTALVVNGKRWVLIPDTAIDQRELRVPQEWVEIPDWAADYYLAVQVNLDEGWLRIWGYTSHAQLHSQGDLDLSDRTYSLDEDQLLSNINAFCLAQSVSFSQPLRSEVTRATAPLETTQAHQLIERLSQTQETFPRLSIPFSQWSSLISHNGWRQSLYERRQGLPEQHAVLQWLRNGISEIGTQLGWQPGSPMLTPAIAMRSEAGTETPKISREIHIAGQALALTITQRPGDLKNAWRFILRPTAENAQIPTGTVLRLLSEKLDPFPHNEDIAAENCTRLYVDVALDPGEGIIWETEPTSEDYVQELLKF